MARSSCGTALSLPRQGAGSAGWALAPEVGMRTYLEGGRTGGRGKKKGGREGEGRREKGVGRREKTALLELQVRC